jgi:CheY-like chemotaxis protein
MDALSGLRVLVAGSDPVTIEAARSGLAAEGASVEICPPDPAAAGSIAASGDPPAAIVALGDSQDALAEALDPLRLGLGCPIVPILDIVGYTESFDAAAARRRRGGFARSSSCTRCGPATGTSRA